MATAKPVTMQDLINVAEDDHRYDLIRGKIHRAPPAGGKHGEIAFEFAGALRTYLRDHPIGKGCTAETGFALARDPDVLLAPDVAFVRVERLPPADERLGFLEIAPDIAIEIISPFDRATRVTEKVLEYLRAGVAEVWLVDPEERTLAGDDEFAGSDVLPGFTLPLADLFS